MLDVQLEKFQGPLELLVQLIEQNRLAVTDVALAQVTDQYIEAVRSMETHSMADLADFMLVASRLLLVKSKALLPSLSLTQEEEQEVRALKVALAEYQRYKEKVRYLKDRAQSRIGIVTRDLWQGRQPLFLPPDGFSREESGRFFANALALWEKFVKPKDKQVLERAVSIEQKIQDIIARIGKQAQTSLHDLAGNSKKKMDIIVAFLALLFLFREKMVSLEQSENESDLTVTKLDPISQHG